MIEINQLHRRYIGVIDSLEIFPDRWESHSESALQEYLVAKCSFGVHRKKIRGLTFRVVTPDMAAMTATSLALGDMVLDVSHRQKDRVSAWFPPTILNGPHCREHLSRENPMVASLAGIVRIHGPNEELENWPLDSKSVTGSQEMENSG
jgi:hypothetical protein